MSDRELTLEADTDPQSVKFHNNLEDLTFKGPPFSKFKAAIKKLTTLTKFHLVHVNSTDNPTLNDLLGILKNNPKLEDFFIHPECLLKPGVKPGIEDRIELPKLKSLFLRVECWKNVEHIISPIRIPCAKGIKVEILCDQGHIPLDDALKYIGDIPSSLTSAN